MSVRHSLFAVSVAMFTSVALSHATAQSGTPPSRPCPGPGTEAELVAVAHAEPSDDRVIDWMTTCGVAFPIGWDTLERLVNAGVSKGIAGAAVPGRYFYLLSNPSDLTISGILANMRPGTVAGPFSADDKAKLMATSNAPNVGAIRTLLNRYHSSRPLMTDPEDQRRATLLDGLPPESLTGLFAVLAVNPLAVGGEAITIMFVHPSHLVLDVHVKDGAVSFLRPKSLSKEVRDQLAGYYRDILKGPDYLR